MNNIKINAAFKDLKENLPVDNKSWIIINVNTKDQFEVSYLNPNSQFEDGENFSPDVEGFKGFAEYIIGEKFNAFKDRNTQITIADKICTAIGSQASIEEDFDEDSKKTYKVSVPKAQIIEVYNGLDLDRIPEIIKRNLNELNKMERDAQMEAVDSYEYKNDPYKYHGVNKSDFF